MTNAESQRLNQLKKVKAVQAAYNEVWEEDMTKKFVWRKFIRDKYFIGYRSFLRMLYVDVEAERKQIEADMQTTQ